MKKEIKIWSLWALAFCSMCMIVWLEVTESAPRLANPSSLDAFGVSHFTFGDDTCFVRGSQGISCVKR